jgi:hypothetical protein
MIAPIFNLLASFRIKKYILFGILFFQSPFISMGQQFKIDSLLILLKTDKADLAKLIQEVETKNLIIEEKNTKP